MPFRSNIDKSYDIERYLEQRAKYPPGEAMRHAVVTKFQVEGWRKDDKFKAREQKAKERCQSLKKTTKRKRKVKAKVKEQQAQRQTKSNTCIVVKDEPQPVISPPEAKGQDTLVAIPQRQEFDNKVQQYRSDLINRLNTRGIYSESDNVQIEVVAKELATLDRYEELRFAPDYAIMCPVRSTTLLELNPLEDKYMSLLRQITRHLQALGLNHDAKDFTTKKKKGVIDKDELNLLYGNGETGLIKAAES